MIPSALITIARNQSWATIDVVTAAQSYQYLNIVLEDFWKDITDNNIWLWINTWTYNLTANTATYTLATPVAASTLLTSTFWIEQLYKIWVKYNSWDTYYTPVSLIYPEWQLKQPDYYAASQNKAVPTATQNDNTITLYPTPTTTVTNCWDPSGLVTYKSSPTVVPGFLGTCIWFSGIISCAKLLLSPINSSVTNS